MPPPTEAGSRLRVEEAALTHPEEDHGWAVQATTVPTEAWTEADILEASQEQTTTVEPGFRGMKHPAAIAPGWLEKPERIAAVAMLTVLGLLVYSVLQRQVRLDLHTHAQQLPGHKGLTVPPHGSGGVGLVDTSRTGPMMDRCARGRADRRCPALSPVGL